MKTSIIIITISIIFGAIIMFIPIQGVFTNNNHLSYWEIQDWNSSVAVAWEWPSTYFATTTGTLINYTLNHYDPSNFTHPSDGILVIGNLTRQTTNNKTAEVLLLSIYGWFPGLVTSASNWSLQEQVAQDATQGQWTLGSLEVNELTYEINGLSRYAINFSYTQDPSVGNQNTSLVYDKATGVLLEGYTEVQFLHHYILRLKLVHSDLISKSNVTSWSSLLSTIFTILGIILASRKIRERRKLKIIRD